jgi:hypothetical protein
VGLRDALARLEAVTAIQLSEHGKLVGADGHMVVTSVGEPLRTVVLGDSPPVVRALQDALSLVPASVVPVVMDSQPPRELDMVEGAQLVLVAAGWNPAAQNALERWSSFLFRALARAKLVGPTGVAPEVLFVGGPELESAFGGGLARVTKVSRLEMTWGTGEAIDLSPLGQHVLGLFEATQAQGSGLRNLEGVGIDGVLSIPSAVLVTARFISEHFGRSLLYMDVGARDTVLVGSAPGKAWARVWPLTGIALGGPGLAQLLVGQSEAGEGVDAETLLNHTFNRAIRPWSLPVSGVSRHLQDRMLLQALRRLWPSGLRPDTLVLSGGFRWLGDREDILEAPAVSLEREARALVELVVDEPVPLAVVGGLSRMDGAAALQVLEGAAGSFLGAYLKVDGGGRLYVDGAEYTLEAGTRLRIPMPSEVAVLKFEGSTGAMEARVAGGKYGLLVDCGGGDRSSGVGA